MLVYKAWYLWFCGNSVCPWYLLWDMKRFMCSIRQHGRSTPELVFSREKISFNRETTAQTKGLSSPMSFFHSDYWWMPGKKKKCDHSVYQIYSVYSIICVSAGVTIIFNTHFSSINFIQSIFNPFNIQYMFWQALLRLLYALLEKVPFFFLNLSFGYFFQCLCVLVLEKAYLLLLHDLFAHDCHMEKLFSYVV